MSNNWLDYYKKVAGRDPDPLLQIALKKTQARDMAYDLGCGAGDDTKYLLSEGFQVYATDKDEASIEFIKSAFKKNKKNLNLEQNSFEKIKFNPCSLIWGRMSFPFCDPKYFYAFWEEMRRSLKTDGLLCGNLFGVNDSWSINKDMTFISHEDWEKLLVGFEIVYFDEKEQDAPTAAGYVKHWHIYDFILKKI